MELQFVFGAVRRKILVLDKLMFEVIMTLEDIRLEMRVNGVEEEDLAQIMAVCKSKGYGAETLDEELEKLGYRRIFSVDEDDEEEYDDLFSEMEPFPHKHRFDDD